MASEIRVNQIQSRTGVSTVSFTDSGPIISGVTTVQGSLNVTDSITGNLTGNATGITTTQITVGDTFLKATNQVGLGQTTTAGRNAGINTAIGTIIYNTDTLQAEIYKGSTFGWKNISHSLIQATGGQVSDYTVGSTVYRAHIFNSSGTFDVSSVGPGRVDLLLVAGGGGGGGSWTISSVGNGGGGGAGGLFYRNDATIFLGANPVVIGAGGVGDGYMEGGNAGTDGGDSTALGITADGGGRGGSYGSPGYDGGEGGSSGGGAYGRTYGPATGVSVANATVVDLISPPAGWGRIGGDWADVSPAYGGGGGGGSAYAGTSGSGTAGGPGGDGLQYTIVGFTTYYAGGGGGGTNDGNPAGSGGLGGGGAGSSNAARAINAIVNTGGGGGGGGNGPGSSYGQGAAGGSGIAVIRYQLADLTAAAKATGGYISYANGKTIHKFEKTGVFTITDPSLTSVDALVIGGGGAGGNGNPSYYGGGGGAGALHYQTNLPVSDASPYAVSVGAGGAGTWYATSNGTTGANSVFSTITAAGGGAGSGAGPQPGFNGGSGGGGAYQPVSPYLGSLGGTGSGDTGGTDNSVSPANGWGNDGGAYAAGGMGGAGGGAGGIGGASLANNGDGGLGLSYNISGSAVTYATGGAGSNTAPGAKGEAYTGNGGNGGRNGYAHPERNSNGGSGIVIISYPS